MLCTDRRESRLLLNLLRVGAILRQSFIADKDSMSSEMG